MINRPKSSVERRPSQALSTVFDRQQLPIYFTERPTLSYFPEYITRFITEQRTRGFNGNSERSIGNGDNQLRSFALNNVSSQLLDISDSTPRQDGSVAEWLACCTQAQKARGSNRSRDAVG